MSKFVSATQHQYLITWGLRQIPTLCPHSVSCLFANVALHFTTGVKHPGLVQSGPEVHAINQYLTRSISDVNPDPLSQPTKYANVLFAHVKPNPLLSCFVVSNQSCPHQNHPLYSVGTG